jgi:hypothetical protein
VSRIELRRSSRGGCVLYAEGPDCDGDFFLDWEATSSCRHDHGDETLLTRESARRLRDFLNEALGEEP